MHSFAVFFFFLVILSTLWFQKVEGGTFFFFFFFEKGHLLRTIRYINVRIVRCMQFFQIFPVHTSSSDRTINERFLFGCDSVLLNGKKRVVHCFAVIFKMAKQLLQNTNLLCKL